MVTALRDLQGQAARRYGEEGHAFYRFLGGMEFMDWAVESFGLSTVRTTWNCYWDVRPTKSSLDIYPGPFDLGM
jgi:hypothetical protein